LSTKIEETIIEKVKIRPAGRLFGTMDEDKSILQRIANFLGSLIETFVMAMAIFVIVYFFLVQPHQVTGNSMLPNFDDGEYILTDKVSYHLHPPKRGDVIVFKAPKNQQKDFIKRIIGLPGEKIKLEKGSVFINGEKLQEVYLPSNTVTLPKSLMIEGQDVLVPLNEYFVLGDNRQHSSDSRDWGTVPRSSIIGKAWLRYWPIRKISLIPQVVYP